MLIPLFFIIRSLNRKQILFFFPLQKGNINQGVLSDANTVQNIGGNMAIFMVSKTFLSNNATFINRKSSLPQQTVILVYVLKLKGDRLFKNSCSSCFLFTSVSVFSVDSYRHSCQTADCAEKRAIFSLFCFLKHKNLDVLKYLPHSLPLFLPAQLKHLLEIVLGAVVAFPCSKGVVMLEYKYNVHAECNTLFQRIHFQRVECFEDFRN